MLRSLHLQPLEERALLAIDSRLDAGVFTISSDSKDIVLSSVGGFTKINNANPKDGQLAASEITSLRISGAQGTQVIDLSGFSREAFTSVEYMAFVDGPWLYPTRVLAVVDETLGPGWAKKIDVSDAWEYLISGDWKEPLASGHLADQLTKAGWGNASGLLDRIVNEAGARARIQSVLFGAAGVRTPFEVLINGKIFPSADLQEVDEPFAQPLSGDEDVAPHISISDASQIEPHLSSGQASMQFTISISHQYNGYVTAGWTTVQTSPVEALQGTDYQGTSGTVTWATMTGGVSRSISVVVNGDDAVEGNEGFLVQLTTLTNVEVIEEPWLNDLEGRGTIIDADPAPTISVAGETISEPEADNSTANMVFTVGLSSAAIVPVSFKWMTQSVSGGATAGSDYVHVPLTGYVTIAAGQTSKTITVVVKGDSLEEANETFSVVLSDVQMAYEGQLSATGTIVDTDAVPPEISIGNSSLSEPDDGQEAGMVFTVSLSESALVPVKFKWATSEIPGQAESEVDYLEQAESAWVTIAPGQTQATVTVTIYGDDVYELNENFSVSLVDADFAVPGDPDHTSAIGTILNSTPKPRVSVSDKNIDEDVSSGQAVITVSLSHASSQPIVVDWQTADYSALHAAPGQGDYDAASGQLTFAPGQLSRTLTVTIYDDAIPEINERFFVNVTGAGTHAEVDDGQGAVKILDDDSVAIGVNENSSFGTSLGMLSTILSLAPGVAPLKYSVVPGSSGYGIFAVDVTTGEITVGNSAALNYEAVQSYVLTVHIEAPESVGDTKAITINVLDVNEAPYFSAPFGPFSATENPVLALQIATLHAGDPDTNGTIGRTFSILRGDEQQHFTLTTVAGGGAVLKYRPQNPVNHEAQSTYALTVEVRDAGGLTSERTFTVNIQNLPESPEVSDQSFPIAENSPKHSVVGRVAAYVDPGETRTFSFVGSSGPFAINSATGQITVTNPAALDYESLGPTHSFTTTVRVSDGTSPPTDAQVTINVLDANDSPTMADAVFSVNEGVLFNSEVGTITGDDEDSADKLRFAITTGNELGIFAVQPGSAGSREATIVVARPELLSHDGQPEHTLWIQVTDDGKGRRSSSAKVTINVGDMNLAPSIRDYEFTIPDNVPNGGLLGYVHGSDPNGDSLTYSILGTSSIFAINSSSGRITVIDTNQVVASTPLTFTVVVTDGTGLGALTDSAVVTVQVTAAGTKRDVTLDAIVRDFTFEHVDFQNPVVETWRYPKLTGLVENQLGPDAKPRLTQTPYVDPEVIGAAWNGIAHPSIDSNQSFAEWYNDVDGINKRVVVPLSLLETSPGSGVYAYNGNVVHSGFDPPGFFFPIDGVGWADSADDATEEPHNFYFTTEMRATFTYHAGEGHVFDLVESDDDLWVFINGKLAIDIGGVHGPMGQGVDLDAMATTLGIVDGGTYSLDIFFAERNTDESHINISTTIPDITPVVSGLVEETRFLTNDQAFGRDPVSIVIPESTAAIAVQFGDLVFDQHDLNSINDAFELALVDEQGRSLVPTIGVGRDAFLNITEDESPLLARGVGLLEHTVIVDVSHLAPGTRATLIARLVNNDGVRNSVTDELTKVTVEDRVRFLSSVDTGSLSGTMPLATPSRSTRPSIGFMNLQDVSTGFDVAYRHTSFNEATNVLDARVDLTNNGHFRLRTDHEPILVGVKNISAPFVSLVEPDGYAPDGMPYFEVTSLWEDVGSDERHEDAETIEGISLRFSNPSRVRFSYDLVVLGAVNRGPQFQTDPVVEVQLHNPSGYVYAAIAADPENDDLSYELIAGPPLMEMDSDTGVVTWQPVSGDVGTPQLVTIRVRDAEVLFDTQTFSINVVDMPNRPPVFTSMPIVDAFAGVTYVYQAIAVDQDGDDLTYSPLVVPPGEFAFPLSGLAEWTPSADDIGHTYPVELAVTDGHGTDIQRFRIRVLADPRNRPPVITSEAPERFDFLRLLQPQITGGTIESTVGSELAAIRGQTWLDVNANGERDHFDDLNTLVLGALDDEGEFVVELGPNDDGSWGAPIDLGFTLEFFDDANGMAQNFTQFFLNNNGNISFNGPVAFFKSEMMSDLPYPMIAPFWSDVDTRPPESGKVKVSTGISERDQPYIRVDWPDVAYFGIYGFTFPGEMRQNDFTLYIEDDPDGDIVAFAYRNMEWTTGAANGGINGLDGRAARIGFSAGNGVNFAEFGTSGGAIAQDGTPPSTSALLAPFQGTDETPKIIAFRINPSGAGGNFLEPGADGFVVELVDTNTQQVVASQISRSLDLNQNSIIDPFTEIGLYRFENVLPGTYEVRVQPRDPFVQSDPTVVQTVTVAGGDRLQRDFGFYRQYLYAVDATDPDGDDLTYELVSSEPATDASLDENGRLEWLPPSPGTYSFTVAVFDGRGGHDEQTFEVVVVDANANVDPVITSRAPIQGATNRAYSYTVRADDANFDPLTFELMQRPDGMDINPRTGVITWTPRSDQQSAHVVRVRVNDPRGGHDDEEFTINVALSPINNSPIITSTPVTAAVVDVNYSYPVRATDIENDPLSFDLVSYPEGMWIQEVYGYLNWRPLADQIGTHEVIVRVRSGINGVDLQSFTVTVTGPNQAPRISSDPVTQAGLSGYNYQVIASDANGDSLTYSLDDASSALGLSISSTGLITWNDQSNPAIQLGTCQVTVVVADGRGEFDRQTFSLVIGTDSPPQITSTPIRSADLGEDYSYLVTVSDEEDDPNEIELSIDLQSWSRGMRWLNESSRTITGSGTLTWSPSVTGDFPVELTATDTFGNRYLQRFAVRVFDPDAVNEAPIFTSGPTGPAVAGRQYQYHVTAEDPNGDTVTLSLLDASAFGPTDPFDEQTGLFTWTPSAGGAFPVAFQADDGHGNTSTQSFTLVVLSNAPPIVTSWANATVYVNQAMSPITFDAVDPNGDSFTFSLDGQEPLMVIGSTTGILNWHPTAVGTYSFNVVVTDDFGARGIQPVVIHVIENPNDPNEAPQVSDNIVRSIQAGRTFRHQVIATDPDGDALSYELQGAPSGATIDNHGLLRWETTVADINDVDTPYEFSVLVTDGHSHEVEVDFTLRVTVDAPANRAAQILALPPAGAVVDKRYDHTLEGLDADGDSVFWSLEDGPDGATIEMATGRLRWTPTVGQLGTHEFKVRIVDSFGAGETVTFPVTVRGVNLPPQIAVAPPTSATEGVPFDFQIEATDPEGDPLEYEVNGPSGMVFLPLTKTVHWENPVVGQNPYPFSIRVTTPDGQYDEIETTLTVVAASGNSQPVFDSTPIFYAVAGETYEYQIEAHDDDPSDTIVLNAVIDGSPTGFNGVGLDNKLTWAVGSGEAGNSYWVTVTAFDGVATVPQRYRLQVLASNNPPQLDLPESINHPRGADFSLDLRQFATDLDYQPLTFVVNVDGNGLPQGFSISPAGVISWPNAPIGDYTVEVTVTDPVAAFDVDSFELNVVADTTPPVVAVQPSALEAPVGGSITFYVQATDNVAVASIVLYLERNGQTEPYAVGPNGSVTVTLDASGVYEVWAVAKDTADPAYEGSSTPFEVRALTDQPPTVQLTSPTNDQVITRLVEVIGSVSNAVNDDDITYSVQLVPTNSTDPSAVIDLGTFHGARDNEPLGATIDPTILVDGTYLLRVLAQDGASHFQGSDSRFITVESGLKLGNFSLSFTDLEIPFAGFSLSVTRTYDSLRAGTSGDFGYGWQSSMPATHVETGTGDPRTPFLPNTLVTITLPDGSTESFRFLPQPTGFDDFVGDYGQLFEPRFYPADLKTTSTLTLVTTSGNARELEYPFEDDGYYRPGYYADSDRYSPARFGDDYLLTTRTGAKLLLDSQTGKLLTITDRSGNSLAFSGSGITSSTGVGIKFTYDSSGRITDVEAPGDAPGEPSIHYDYNAKGELKSVENREHETSQFKYEDEQHPHYLTAIVDPRGVSVINVQYDEATGRVTSILDADGRSSGLGYNLDLGNGLFLESVSDATGNTTELVRDAQGNTVRRIQHLEINPTDELFNYLITLYKYDAQNKRTHESVPFTHDDPNTRYDIVPADLVWAQQSEYDDSGNVKWVADAQGRKTYFSNYDSFGNPGEIVDPLGNKTTNVYDPTTGNLKKTTDAEGTITEFIYDERGQLETVLVNNNPNPVSHNTYDQLGRLKTVTDASGFTQTFDYNDFNEIIRSYYDWVDPDDLTFPFAHKLVTNETVRDDQGRVTGTRQLVDGVELWHTTTVYTNGLATSTQDRFGLWTHSIYDARGNLIETRAESQDENGDPTWIVSRTVYDENGRAIYTVDPHVDSSPDATFVPAPGTHTVYDSMGRVTMTKRLAEITIALDVDAHGIKFSEVVDPESLTALTYDQTFYDAAGRVDYTRQYDGTGYLISKNVYDVGGRLEKSIQDLNDDLASTADQLVTQYFYDAAGRQTRVVDALNHETRYEYDKVGRQVAVVSPAVHDPETGGDVYVRTETVYDALGRRSRLIENLKQLSPDEGAAIDATMARTTDYEYDLSGRLTAVTLPQVTIDNPQGAGTINVRPRYEYAYDPYGNQKQITSNAYLNGTTVVYLQKDNGVDVVSATRTLGQAVPLSSSTTSTLFVYDEFHRQKSRTLPDGLAESSHYNDLGQLDLSIDFEGRHTAFGYDDLGRLSTKEYFLDDVAYGQDSPEETVTYTYDALGRVVTIDDSNFATATHQKYDAFGRLTQVESPQGIVNYAYDAAGRQSRTWTSHGPQGADLANAITDTSYTYDVLGRLETVDVVERNNVAVTENPTEYRYDKNGNLRQVELPNGVIEEYTYDALNRLTRVRHFDDTASPNNQFGVSTDPVLADFVYTVRTDGQRSKAVETDDQQHVTTIDWLYDALGRLTEERYDGHGTANDFTARYAFDLAGNRAQFAKDIGNVSSNPNLFAADEIIDYLYDQNDRLTRERFDAATGDKTTFYDYDDTEQIAKMVYEGLHATNPGGAGTKLSRTDYGYNVRGRLESVAIDSDGNGTANQTFTYKYDDSRSRVSSHDSVTDDSTIYLVDSNNHTGYTQVLEEGVDTDVDGQLDVGEVDKTYTLGHDVIAQQSSDIASGDALFLLYDGHGSTRALVDPSADVVESYAYDAYGNAIGFDPGAAMTSLLYSGEQTDSTGLQYLRDRYLDPSIGRFISFDAFAGKTSDPLSLHKYLYVHGNPVMGVDPTGMSEASVVGMTGSISIGQIISSITLGGVIDAGTKALGVTLGTVAVYNAVNWLAATPSVIVTGTLSADLLEEFVAELGHVTTAARVQAVEELLRRLTKIYLHYSDIVHSASLLGSGLIRLPGRDGPFATREVYPVGSIAKDRLALKQDLPPNAVFIVAPKPGFYPHTFRYTTGLFDDNGEWMNGGAIEYVFSAAGSGGPGTVSPPIPIPRF